MTATMDREQELAPDIVDVRRVVRGRSLVFFLPAYNEEANLQRVVLDLHRYLAQLELWDFHIVIVNDGSVDATPEIAEDLQSRYSRIRVIHHNPNQGYGGALISGFKAAATSGWDLWAFCDSDGQFASKSVGTVLYELCITEADMVVGRRIGRSGADSKFRFLLGRAWHFVSKALMGRGPNGLSLLGGVTDVDCGLKGGRIKSLSDIVDQFSGKAAAVSPELIARANLAGWAISEVGVTHHSRTAGVSTGSNPKVMIRSAASIAKLSLRLRMERLRLSRAGRLLGIAGLLVTLVAIFATSGRKNVVR